MRILSIILSEDVLKILNELVEKGLYSNLTECIRIALRDYLWEEIEKLE